ncbi:MAG: S-adenosylmethionine decarboxylase [Acidobacteria bacterium]|nr:S-adenosylmethionine decarboxylase [Acidobacteriota bacterium]
MSGVEWLIEAFDCDPAALRDLNLLRRFLDTLAAQLPLHPVGTPVWHRFPSPGGITGMCLLSESHFACHTFPEHGSMTVNLFCCRPRPEWDFAGYLEREFGAGRVTVRRLERDYAAVEVFA